MLRRFGTGTAALSVLCALALCVACGGTGSTSSRSSASASKRAKKSGRSKPAKRERSLAQERRNEARKERKLRKQQAAVCKRVCDRVLDCQLRYARQNLTPDIVDAMRKPAERKRMRARCREERDVCGDGDPDAQELEQTRQCLRKKSCAASLECLDS